MRFFSLLLALALLPALAACAPGSEGPEESDPVQTEQPSPSQSGTAVPFALPVYPDSSLHPIQCVNRANQTLLPLLYEGLFQLDGAFEPQPLLCQSWQESEDGLSWTFTLKSGVTFSDGTPLTARHAADSLNAARQSERYAARLAGLTGASGDEGLTLTVTLSAPNGALPALLDMPVYLERDGACYGTGPYVLTGSAEDEALVLTAREGWHLGAALPMERIPLTPIHQTEDLIHAFDTREAGLVTTDLTGTGSLGYASGYEAWDYDTTTMVYLIFNTKSGPCRDGTLRLALARGMDRTSIANVLFARRVAPSALPVSPASALYDQDAADALSYSVDEMSALLERAGTVGELTLIVNSENSFKTSAADFLAQQWTGAGLTVTVEKLDWEDYLDALERGKFDLCLAETALTPDFDLTALLGTGGSLNYGGWSSAETDALLAAFRAAPLGGEREETAALLYQHLARQVPLAPVCFKYNSVLIQWGVVEGLTPTQANAFYGLGWSVEE